MSFRTGIGRVYSVTISDVLLALSFAAQVIFWFGKRWKTTDPFRKYRIVQAPIEFQVLVVPVVAGYFGEILSFAGGRPVIFGQLSIPAMLMVLSALVLDEIGKSRLLRLVREKWVMPDRIVAFDCVHCHYRHGRLGHSKHPPKKCKTCKTPWKDEWADYVKRTPLGEAYMDEVDPGASW